MPDLDRTAIRDEALRLRQRFEALGAETFEAAVLQPAETLLDLYGEDIRARAYVVSDPLHGEQMMRPDFTVPVVQAHMASGREAARYAYSGVVFRQQDVDPDRDTEYFQAGLEVFGGDPAQADAEVFAAIAEALKGLPLRAVTGDIGVLSAALEGLDTSDLRRAALRRHLWRPARFRALLDRFAGHATPSEGRAGLLARVRDGEMPVAEAGPVIGIRSAGDVMDRLKRLAGDIDEPPIPAEQVALLDRLLSLQGKAADVIAPLREMASQMPALEAAVDRIETRLAALAARGIDTSQIEFEASFGRTTLEYYDGFVFGFLVEGAVDAWPPVASGGRYDALTRVLGSGRVAPAVGGVIRPEQVLKLKGAA